MAGANHVVLFKAREEGMCHEGVAAVVQGIPLRGGDVGQRAVDARRCHQLDLSRKRSASSAAMQPKPAEVMAWR